MHIQNRDLSVLEDKRTDSGENSVHAPKSLGQAGHLLVWLLLTDLGKSGAGTRLLEV